MIAGGVRPAPTTKDPLHGTPGTPLGSTGLRVSGLGLGLMGMSDLYGPADEAESIATVHAALDAGVTLLDTGDFYGMGDNELLLARRCAAGTGTGCGSASSSAPCATPPAAGPATTPGRRR
ncbi:aldo/keto reductase [Nocardiopsis composta]